MTDTKQCTRCKEVKDLSMFGKYKHRSTGYETRCKKCLADMKMEYRHKRGINEGYNQRPAFIMRGGAGYEAHKRRARERAYKLYWEDPDAARLAKRTKHGRAVKWATEFDSFVTYEAHRLAQLRTKMFNMKWHVDHIIPLKGKKVSGLHCYQNLQVIPQLANSYKKNKFDEKFLTMSMPDWLTWTR